MNKKGVIWIVATVAIVALTAVFVFLSAYDRDAYFDIDEGAGDNEVSDQTAEPPYLATNDESDDAPDVFADFITDLTYNDPEPEPEEMPPDFAPFAIDTTRPELLLESSAVMVGGEILDSYTFSQPIDFGFGHTYSAVDGITTFMGNNLRDTGSFGRANINNARFGESWTVRTGSLRTPNDTLWTGHGWTGQPLIVRWPYETRQVMNMHEWAQGQEELVEIIYPAMNGIIYFIELETGRATRNTLNIGFPFKGSGAIDPRGYPLLYVGAGDHSAHGNARIFIISLVDGSVLHTFGLGDGFAPRGGWSMADASPLVDSETDKLIYASENGVLYIIRLNSVFDLAAGTMEIDPDEPYRWRFRGRRSNVNGHFWLGFEASPAIWRGHVFLADNGGHLICLDLNTLEIVWMLDNLDDTNCTPVLAIEDGYPFIYISMAFSGFGWRAPEDARAPVPIRKIDAMTGEIVWETEHQSGTVRGISGGVLATIAVGQHQLGDLIFASIARTPSRHTGLLVALNRFTGETVWEFQTGSHGWGSPILVYDEHGRGFVIHTELVGNIFLIDGMTGVVADRKNLSGHIEATPAVFDSTVVIGTRGQDIWGIRLT